MSQSDPPRGGHPHQAAPVGHRELLGGAAFIVLLVALFHGPDLRDGFVYDDHWTIVENPFLRAPRHALELLGPAPAQAGVPDAGRPVMLATEMVDHAIWKLRPAGYHLQNLLWHAAVSVLWLLSAAALTRSFPVALFGAALFAVHPANVEAVAAINYREDLLAAFFILASLAALRMAPGPRTARRTAAFVLATLGILSKESAIMAPILLVLVDILGGAVPEAEQRARRWDWLALAAAVALATGWRSWVMGGVGVVSRTALVPSEHRRWLYALPEGARAFVAGAARLVLPFGLSPEYDDPPPTAGWTTLRWAAVAGLVSAAAAAWRGRRTHPVVALGILAGLAAALPTAGLVPISNLRADRYLYLPSMPLLLALAAVLVPVLERALAGPPVLDLPRPWVAMAAVLLLLGLATLHQGRYWRNDLALWTRGVAEAPRSPRAWNALGEARLQAGQPRAALEAARRSLDLLDDFQGRELAGLAQMELGDLPSARGLLARALDQAPPAQRAELLNDLGLCEMQLGLLDAALARFVESRRLAPGYDRPWLNAAQALERAGRSDEARALLEALTRALPESYDGWEALGAARQARGQASEAEAAYRRAAALGGPPQAFRREAR